MAKKPESEEGTRQTMFPQGANIRVGARASGLDDTERVELQTDLFQLWTAQYTSRANLNENLQAYESLYGLDVEPMDWPWVNAANLQVPIVPAELDSMWAYVAAQVFVQRLVIVTAGDNDPETQRLAPLVEKFYNAEMRRIRGDGKTLIQHFLTTLHLGLRDGAGPLTVTWNEKVVPKLIVTNEPKVGDDGTVETDEGGMPSTERTMTRVQEIVSEATVKPYLLKEWYLNPDESTSVQSALAISTVEWMTEKELWSRYNEFKKNGGPGEWYKDNIEEVLARLTTGVTDVAADPLGSYDKDAQGQIDIGQGQGALVSKFFKNRGPAQVIMTLSNEFDMDGDGEAELNVFWHYAQYARILGWSPYEYVTDKFNSFVFAPFPRPDRVYGYSLCERLADITADASAGRNQRRNYIDLEIMPVILERDGDTIRDKDQAVYPGARWRVEDPEKSLKWWGPPPLSPDSFSDEGRLDVYVSKLTGQNAPALGQQSSGRRTATETRQQQLAQSVRANLVAMIFRSFLREVLQFMHLLNKQNLGTSKATTEVDTATAQQYQSQPGHMEIDGSVLMRNFNIDISGLSDPVDAPSRRMEMTGALGVMAKVFPWIFSDPKLSYAWAETYVDTFQWAGTERLIGTAQDADARAQALQAQAQAQAQAAAGGQPGGGAPHPGGPPGAGPGAQNGHAPPQEIPQ